MRLAALPLLLLALTGAGPVCDAVWRNPARGRDVPVRIQMPEPPTLPRGGNPVILYSPGLGGDTRAGSAWARIWLEHGFAVITMAHAGSGPAVYAGTPSPEERRARFRAATSSAEQLARAADASFIIDELQRRKTEGACDLEQLAADEIAIAGHSMGAWTAQALAGQPINGRSVADPRIEAAVLMSTTGPSGAAARAAFGGITIPVMVVTGTRDGVGPQATEAEAAAAMEQRTAVYTGMPANGRKYLLVVAGAEHMMFDGKTLKPDAGPLASHVQRIVGEMTGQFFGAWMLGDDESAAIIESQRPPWLAPADLYARK
jgi:predicted dienelactone hydrolase